jgi:DNA-binding transcriptional regulator GbsR (MarR family)
MEAITIAGLAVLAVGGYYSIIDFTNDLGIGRNRVKAGVKKLPVSQLYIVTHQPGIKKMAGMHV